MRSDHQELILASACTVAGKLNEGEVTPLDLLDAPISKSFGRSSSSYGSGR
jgi:hypothetical protein